MIIGVIIISFITFLAVSETSFEMLPFDFRLTLANIWVYGLQWTQHRMTQDQVRKFS